MKKVLGVLLAVAMMATMFTAFTAIAAPSGVYTGNLITNGDFETASPANLGTMGGTITRVADVARGGAYSLRNSNRVTGTSAATWYSPTIDVASIIKAGGAATYKFSAFVRTSGVTTDAAGTTIASIGTGNMAATGMIRADTTYSFSTGTNGTDTYKTYTSSVALSTLAVSAGWKPISFSFVVTAADITLMNEHGAACSVKLCFDTTGPNYDLYVDNLTLVKEMDSSEITIPTDTGDYGIFPNGGFESALSGWTAVGGSTPYRSTEQVHNGSVSLKLDGRDAAYKSPQYNIYSLIKANGAGTYAINMWVYADGLAANANAGVLIRCTASDTPATCSFLTGTSTYKSLSITVVPNKTWTQISATLTVTENDLTCVSGYTYNLCTDGMNSPILYIDDLSISKVSTDNIMNGTFETDTAVPGLTGWSGTFSSTSVLSLNADAHSGSYSMMFTRPGTYSSAATDITPILKANGVGKYLLTYWAKLDTTATGAEPITAYFSNGSNHLNAISTTITKDAWTKVMTMVNVDATALSQQTATGTSVLRWQGDGTSPTTTAFLVDDVSLKYMGADGVAALGEYGYDFSYPTLTTNYFWHRIDSLGSDVWNTTTGVATVVIKNTGSAAFTAYLDSRDNATAWGNMVKSGNVTIPAGEIRTIVLNNIPSGNTLLLLQLGNLTTDSTFTLGNITQLTKANDLKSSQVSTQTVVTLTELDAADDYTPVEPTATPAPTASPTAGPTASPVPTTAPTAVPARTIGPDGNIFFAGDMEGAAALTGWGKIQSASTLSLDTTIKHGGAQSLKESGRTAKYSSASYNLYDLIKANGAGDYTVKAWVYATADSTGAQIRIRGDNAAPASFMKSIDASNVGVSSDAAALPKDTWTEVTVNFTVTAADIAAATGKFNFTFDGITAGADVYMDDIMVIDNSKVTTAPEATATPKPEVKAFQYTVDGTTDLSASGILELFFTSGLTGHYDAATDTATFYIMNTSDKTLTFQLNVGWSWSLDGDNMSSAIGEEVEIAAGAVAKITATHVSDYFAKTAADPFYDATKPLDGTSVVRLIVNGAEAGDTFLIAGPTALGTVKALGLASDVTTGFEMITAPTALANLVNGEEGTEGTADAATVGYAIAAISALGALAVGKRRFKK